MPAAVVYATLGALGLKLLELAELSNVPTAQRPDFRRALYWLPFLILPALGGGLAYAYLQSGVDMQPILAVNVGVSAPLILRSMAEINPLGRKTIDPGPGA